VRKTDLRSGLEMEREDMRERERGEAQSLEWTRGDSREERRRGKVIKNTTLVTLSNSFFLLFLLHILEVSSDLFFFFVVLFDFLLFSGSCF